MDVGVELSALEHTFDRVHIDREQRIVRLRVEPYSGDDAALHFVGLDLTLRLPDLYPETDPPVVAFENVAGASDTRLQALRQRLDQEVAEAAGEPVLVQLCVAAQEELTANDHPEGVHYPAAASHGHRRLQSAQVIYLRLELVPAHCAGPLHQHRAVCIRTIDMSNQSRGALPANLDELPAMPPAATRCNASRTHVLLLSLPPRQPLVK